MIYQAMQEVGNRLLVSFLFQPTVSPSVIVTPSIRARNSWSTTASRVSRLLGQESLHSRKNCTKEVKKLNIISHYLRSHVGFVSCTAVWICRWIPRF
jgi:hypothetical protein